METQERKTTGCGVGWNRIRQVTHSKPVRFAVLVCAVILAAYLVLCLCAAVKKTVFANVFVSDISLSGMTEAAAQQAIEGQREALSAEIAIPVFLDGAPVGEITTTQLHAVFDSEKTARDAFSAGREGGFFSGGWMYFRCLTKKTVLAPRFSAEMDAIRACAEEFSEGVNRVAADGSYRVADGKLYLTRQSEGEDVAVATLQSSLYDALRRGEYGRADCTGLCTEGKPLDLAAVQSELAHTRNAAYDKKTATVTAEKVGVIFDIDAAQALLVQAAPGGEVSVDATFTAPEVTKAWLEDALFRDELGTYSTYAAGTAERIGNIARAAEKINGTVLNAGETFSFNDAVGAMTKENGFAPASVNPGDSAALLPGGGVSQTASTLYEACMLANLTVTQRHSHTLAPDFITFGCDAAAGGDGDFCFCNDTDYPIRIVARLTGNNLRVAIQGCKTDGTSVRIITQTVSTNYYQTVYRETDTLPMGQMEEQQSPYIGYSVRTYRNVYDASGELISSALEAESEYEARDRIVLTGTAMPETPPEQEGKT